jgi:hypothetical protein
MGSLYSIVVVHSSQLPASYLDSEWPTGGWSCSRNALFFLAYEISYSAASGLFRIASFVSFHELFHVSSFREVFRVEGIEVVTELVKTASSFRGGSFPRCFTILRL